MIEQTIEKLIQAVEENTAALKAILSAGAAEPAPTTTPKPKAVKPKKEEAIKVDPQTELVQLQVEAPAAEEDEEEDDTATEVAEVPDLATPELRDALKKLIKDKMFADPLTKSTFADTRTKFGIQLLAELSDEQVRPFYEEVLSW